MYSPNGVIVASGSWDRLVKLWDPRGRSPLVQTFDGHIDWVTNLSFSGDGMYIASCSSDRKVNIWDIRKNSILSTFKGHTAAVRDVCFSPNDQFICSGSDDRSIIVWDAFSGSELLTLTGHTAPITGLSWSNDSRYFISSSKDCTVKLWQIDIIKKELSKPTVQISSPVTYRTPPPTKNPTPPTHTNNMNEENPITRPRSSSQEKRNAKRTNPRIANIKPLRRDSTLDALLDLPSKKIEDTKNNPNSLKKTKNLPKTLPKKAKSPLVIPKLELNMDDSSEELKSLPVPHKSYTKSVETVITPKSPKLHLTFPGKSILF